MTITRQETGFSHRSKGYVTGTRFQNRSSGDTLPFTNSYGFDLVEMGLQVGQDFILRFPLSGKEFHFSELRYRSETDNVYVGRSREACMHQMTVDMDGVRRVVHPDRNSKCIIELAP